MCGKSLSESGYLKRNMRGPTQEKNHFSAPNVTEVFQHQYMTNYYHIMHRVEIPFRYTKCDKSILSQITERIAIGALQVLSL